MKNVLVGFRTESYSGSGVRDITSVLQHEIFVSQNLDCLKTCFNLVRNTNFGKSVGRLISNIEKNNNIFDITMLPIRYREQNGKPFFEKLVHTMSKETNVDLHYALWLCDKSRVLGREDTMLYYGTKDTTDMYIQGPVSLCDAGDKGVLFGYPYNPKPMDYHKELEVRREFKKIEEDKIPLDEPGITVEMRAVQAALLLKLGVKLDKTWQIGTRNQILLGSCLVGQENDPVWEQLAVIARNDNQFARVITNDSEFFLGKGKQVENAVWQGLCDKYPLKEALATGLKWMKQNDLSIDHLNNLIDYYKDSKSFLLIKTKEGFSFLPAGSPKDSYESKLAFLESRDVIKMYYVHREDGIRLVNNEEACFILKNASRDFVNGTLKYGDTIHFKEDSYLYATDDSFVKLKRLDKVEFVKPFVRLSQEDMVNRLQVEGCQFISYGAVNPKKIPFLLEKVNKEDQLIVPVDATVKAKNMHTQLIKTKRKKKHEAWLQSLYNEVQNNR